MPDIFDTSDVSDLPEELQRAISRPASGVPKIYEPIFSQAGRPLTVREVMVARYRLHGKVMSRQRCGTILHMMMQRGQLVRVARGTYALPEHAKAAE